MVKSDTHDISLYWFIVKEKNPDSKNISSARAFYRWEFFNIICEVSCMEDFETFPKVFQKNKKFFKAKYTPCVSKKYKFLIVEIFK